jgi:hypothetical protein
MKNQSSGTISQRNLILIGMVVGIVALVNLLSSSGSTTTPGTVTSDTTDQVIEEGQRLRSEKVHTEPPIANVVIDEEEEVKLAEQVFGQDNLVNEDEVGHGAVEHRHYAEPDKVRSTMFFHHYKKGKSGGVIEDMLMAHAYCFHHNATYGGSCGEPSNKKATHEALLDAIGLKHALPFACPQDHIDDKVTRKSMIPRTNFHSEDTRIWTPGYVEHLKTMVKYPPKVPDKFTIAVHIRRGDVTPCRMDNKGYNRYLPNQHFQALIDEYNQPGARVVIFSQSKSYESLDEFERKGYEMELDSDLQDIWRTIVTSDVVILSRSDFSMIPAIVAKGTVVYTPFWHPPLRPWKRVGPEIMKETDAETKRLQETCPVKNALGGDTFGH